MTDLKYSPAKCPTCRSRRKDERWCVAEGHSKGPLVSSDLSKIRTVCIACSHPWHDAAALPESKEMPGQRSAWISVKERMPKFGILVLVANQAWYPGWPKVMHGHLDSEGEWCGHYADLERCGQPTEKGLPTS